MPLRPRIAVALTLAALALLGGCGSEGDPATPDTADAVPLTFIQTARSGSFFGSGEDLELVLRGVGGAAALGAEGSGGGGSAGAISTPVLFRRATDLLGPEPMRATLSGAEVLPQRYELELEEPRYDGTRGELSFAATVVGGAPERPPASFGAVTLTIASGLPGHVLTGRVGELDPEGTDAEPGEGIEGALITVRLAGLGLVTASTGADGSFSVGPLPAGAYEVEAGLAGYARDIAERTLPPGSEPLELGLEPIEGAPAVTNPGAPE